MLNVLIVSMLYCKSRVTEEDTVRLAWVYTFKGLTVPLYMQLQKLITNVITHRYFYINVQFKYVCPQQVFKL